MLNLINRSLPDFSPSERQVAEWIVRHPQEAVGATLAHVANECGTSEPTVIRFCRRVGLQGFRELGIRLTEAMSNPTSYVHRDVQPNDTSSDAIIKVMDASIKSLIDMKLSLSQMPIDEAVEAIGRIDRIDRNKCRQRVEENFTIDCMVVGNPSGGIIP